MIKHPYFLFEYFFAEMNSKKIYQEYIVKIYKWSLVGFEGFIFYISIR